MSPSAATSVAHDSFRDSFRDSLPIPFAIPFQTESHTDASLFQLLCSISAPSSSQNRRFRLVTDASLFHLLYGISASLLLPIELQVPFSGQHKRLSVSLTCQRHFRGCAHMDAIHFRHDLIQLDPELSLFAGLGL